jgi:hypothetical protein
MGDHTTLPRFESAFDELVAELWIDARTHALAMKGPFIHVGSMKGPFIDVGYRAEPVKR